MKRLLLPFFVLACTLSLAAQSAFQPKSTASAYTLDAAEFQDFLQTAPLEFSVRKSNTVVSLPLPDGSFAEFEVFNSPLVDIKNINSFVLRGPWGGGRISASAHGISGMLMGPDGFFVIDRAEDYGDEYFVRTYEEAMELDNGGSDLACGYDHEAMTALDEMIAEEAQGPGAEAGAEFAFKAGNDPRELRVYDLVMTSTPAFAAKFGQNTTVETVIEKYNEAVTIINALFENQVGIRMNLIVYEGLAYLNDGSGDPFPVENMGGELLDDVIVAFNENSVPANSYDLGHLFTAGCTDVGGVVSGNACTNGKTRGVTCVGGSVAGVARGIMAHEIAHQFTVSHSWNRCPGSEGQRAGQTALEPGSGTTIMSYAGACSDQNIGGRQPYYNIGNLEQFLFFTREGGAADCATVIETDNFTPDVSFDYEDDFYMPISTPFRLVGDATDANDDNLTFNWEQADLGPDSPIQNPTGNAPLFRSVAPSSDGNVRYFPNLARIVNNISNTNEVLPTYSRDMTFRLTARDNNPEAGGLDFKQLHFFATDQAGPFLVNNPADTDWNVGDYQEITWDVANTDQAPVNCKRVNILLSRNGGNSFDVVLAENVPNTGSAFVTVQEGMTSGDAIVMVEAADNVFLNVNLSSFRIEPAEQAVFTLETGIRYAEVCLPETVVIDLNSGSILDFDNPISLSVVEENLPDGTVVNFSETTLMPGENGTVELDLTGVNFTGRTAVEIIAVAEGQDTARRTVILDVVSNDYTDLATTAPVEGTGGIILAADFDWTDAINADAYDIQIATSPTFAEETIFLEDEGLALSEFRNATQFFESNTLYFWRVRPLNACGTGDWLDPNSFRTVNSQCVDYAQNDPTTLPGTGPAFVRESTLFIEESGVINDLNLPNVNVRYNFASKVKITLVSPAGTEVVLYDEKCFGSTNRIDLGFDDDAPISVTCPPDDERVFIPEGSLADFNGEDTFGEWILRVNVSETGGSAGAIDGWNVQFCADISATAPERLVNTTTEVMPLGRNSIERDKLETISEAFGSDEVNYTLTALPKEGTLFLYGNALSVGDEFQQDDINGIGLIYENTNGDATTDDFGFVVTTPDGGYLAIDYHDILISEDATVSNGNVSVLEDNLSIFPNPTDGDLTVRWTATVNRDLNLQLFDLNGRLLQNRTVNGRARNVTLATAELPNGVYLLRIDGAVRRVVKQ